jgi:hypothetical protein
VCRAGEESAKARICVAAASLNRFEYPGGCSYFIIMDVFKFVWDENKAELNIQRHGISFEEALTVFYDLYAKEFYDPTHSELEEDRFLILGFSSGLRMLMVCYCYLENDTVIRIITARKATKRESQHYGG